MARVKSFGIGSRTAERKKKIKEATTRGEASKSTTKEAYNRQFVQTPTGGQRMETGQGGEIVQAQQAQQAGFQLPLGMEVYNPDQVDIAPREALPPQAPQLQAPTGMPGASTTTSMQPGGLQGVSSTTEMTPAPEPKQNRIVGAIISWGKTM